MKNKTFSNGCLGSHNDEERSEMRYVMRIAKPASHQIFERNLHFPRGVCLHQCLFIPTLPFSFLFFTGNTRKKEWRRYLLVFHFLWKRLNSQMTKLSIPLQAEERTRPHKKGT